MTRTKGIWSAWNTLSFCLQTVYRMAKTNNLTLQLNNTAGSSSCFLIRFCLFLNFKKVNSGGNSSLIWNLCKSCLQAPENCRALRREHCCLSDAHPGLAVTLGLALWTARLQSGRAESQNLLWLWFTSWNTTTKKMGQIYPSNLQAILVICGISCQITLCSACSHRLTPWHSPTSDLCLLSCPNVLCISIQLTPPEHLDWKIFSQDYDTDRGYFRSEWLWCLGCGAQAEMLGWVCWVPTEGPERRRSNPADILSKQRIAAKASEMAENTECCASYLRAEHAPSQLSVHRNIESFNRIPQG